MLSDSRTTLLCLLSELSDANPDLRFGQLVANLATLARGAEVEAIWDAEDGELVAAAERLLSRYHVLRTDVA